MDQRAVQYSFYPFVADVFFLIHSILFPSAGLHSWSRLFTLKQVVNRGKTCTTSSRVLFWPVWWNQGVTVTWPWTSPELSTQEWSCVFLAQDAKPMHSLTYPFSCHRLILTLGPDGWLVELSCVFIFEGPWSFLSSEMVQTLTAFYVFFFFSFCLLMMHLHNSGHSA